MCAWQLCAHLFVVLVSCSQIYILRVFFHVFEEGSGGWVHAGLFSVFLKYHMQSTNTVVLSLSLSLCLFVGLSIYSCVFGRGRRLIHHLGIRRETDRGFRGCCGCIR